MNNKKRVYQAEAMALPPIKMVLGDIPAPIPSHRIKPADKPLKDNYELESAVQRLIIHLKKKSG